LQRAAFVAALFFFRGHPEERSGEGPALRPFYPPFSGRFSRTAQDFNFQKIFHATDYRLREDEVILEQAGWANGKPGQPLVGAEDEPRAASRR